MIVCEGCGRDTPETFFEQPYGMESRAKCNVCGHITVTIEPTRFPIMGKAYGEKVGWVPFAFMERFNERAKKNHGGQGIRRLLERSGLSPQEAMAVVQDADWDKRRWRDDGAAWANLQLIVSAEFPDWSFN